MSTCTGHGPFCLPRHLTPATGWAGQAKYGPGRARSGVERGPGMPCQRAAALLVTYRKTRAVAAWFLEPVDAEVQREGESLMSQTNLLRVD